MKKSITAFLLSFSLSVSAAGIPTFDGVAVTNMLLQVQNTLTQIDNQIAQIEEAKNAVEQAKKQYNSTTGSRGLGNILNDSSLRNNLPAEWVELYEQGDLEGITDAQNKYLQRLKENRSQLKAGYNQTSQRFKNVESLMNSINNATDPKAAQDLSNRLAAENAIIQTEQNRLSMLISLQQQETLFAEQQKTQEFKSFMFNKNQ